MTGLDHYREAERLLIEAADQAEQTGDDDLMTHGIALRAQGHAILALVAASVLMPGAAPGPNTMNWDAWRDVTGGW